jgi:hypothetical protein
MKQEFTDIWFNDIAGFLRDANTWTQFLPNSRQNLSQQLNSIVIFALYFTIGLIIIKRDIRIIYVFLFILLVTWFIYTHYEQDIEKKKELYDNLKVKKQNKWSDKMCVLPTKENPFMNVSMSDYQEFPNRPEACKDDSVSRDIDSLFNQELPRETLDIFGKGASDRQFFTNPITTIPNNRDDFTRFLYDIKPTLKQQDANY